MEIKQRVGGTLVKTLYTFYKIFGYNFVYFCLYFVVLYYFLFATNVRSALKKYYKNIGIKFSNKIFFKHLFNYAISTSDRFISKADPQLYRFINIERLLFLKEIEKGSILLLNHFGGWATSGNYFFGEKNDTKINIVMNETMIKKAHEFEQLIQRKNENNVKIINLSKGDISTSISIAKALIENESVALMGDRAINKKYLKKIKFFGKEANFNKAPFTIAYKTKRPIIAMFIILKSKKEYELIYKKINLDNELEETKAIELAMNEYILLLSKIIIKHPLQWFNFYDFWEEE